MSDITTIEITITQQDYTEHKSEFNSPDIIIPDKNGLVCLTYRDMSSPDLSFAHWLTLLSVPYDMSWFSGDRLPAGKESCRVHEDGRVEVKRVNDNSNTINIDKVLKAFETGTLEDLVRSATIKDEIMPWSDQVIIMERRSISKTHLREMKKEELDELVVNMCAEQHSVSNTFSADERANNINNNSKDDQIAFLIDSGYLMEGMSRHQNKPVLHDFSRETESYSVVVMSISHLTQRDVELLNENANYRSDSMVMARETGIFIKLYSDEDMLEENLRHGHSETIRNIIKLAASEGYQMIEFDADAAIYPDFPSFDW